MESKIQITSNYIALLDHLRNLFIRENITNNTYLTKHIKHNLQVPLFLIAEERKVAALTNQETLILQALQESGLVRLHNNRQIAIIEYPTIKISLSDESVFEQLKKLLKESNKKYGFSQRIEKEYVNLTLYEQNSNYLQQLMKALHKQVQFQKVSLFQDIKLGTSRIKKLKQEYNRNNGTNGSYGRGNKYSLEKPPNIFIRKAVDSEEELSPDHRDKHGDRKKKYKQVLKEEHKQPKFNQDDFPTLN